jgi:hypothetical protein
VILLSSFGSVETYVRGRLFTINFTSTSSVCKVSSFGTFSSSSAYNACLTFLIKRSHTPPKCGAPGGLNFHFNSASANLRFNRSWIVIQVELSSFPFQFLKICTFVTTNLFHCTSSPTKSPYISLFRDVIESQDDVVVKVFVVNFLSLACLHKMVQICFCNATTFFTKKAIKKLKIRWSNIHYRL